GHGLSGYFFLTLSPTRDALFYSRHRPPPRSTLFPYTTLFRSREPIDARSLQRPLSIRAEVAPTEIIREDENDIRRRGRRRSPVVDRKSTRLNSSHVKNSYAVFCLKKKMNYITSKTITILSSTM